MARLMFVFAEFDLTSDRWWLETLLATRPSSVALRGKRFRRSFRIRVWGTLARYPLSVTLVRTICPGAANLLHQFCFCSKCPLHLLARIVQEASVCCLMSQSHLLSQSLRNLPSFLCCVTNWYVRLTNDFACRANSGLW